MITANELRIGNLVNFQTGTSMFQGKVTAITETRIVVDGVTSKYASIEPIPLTEEWLIKLNFDLCTNKIDTWFINSNFLPFKMTFTVNKNKLIPDYMSTCLRYAKIDYVHQLQNLYFALTGEELKLKL